MAKVTGIHIHSAKATVEVDLEGAEAQKLLANAGKGLSTLSLTPADPTPDTLRIERTATDLDLSGDEWSAAEVAKERAIDDQIDQMRGKNDV